MHSLGQSMYQSQLFGNCLTSICCRSDVELQLEDCLVQMLNRVKRRRARRLRLAILLLAIIQVII